MKNSKESKNSRIHLEIQTHRSNPYGLLRTTYREDGLIKHETLSRLTGLDLDTLKLIQAALQGNVILKSDFKVLSSREYGASFALLQVAKATGLDKAIYSKTSEPWVRDCLALIIGTVVYAGSKLSLTRMNKDSALWEICGIHEEEIDVNIHCYEAMDQLFQRQDSIQKKLVEKHLLDGTVILYDITSSYFEGEYADTELVTFGYNRDKKRGHEQIVIALICSQDGCPVAVEVLLGNTKDETTVSGKILDIKEKYGIKDVIFVGDRGMMTKTQFEKIQENEQHEIKTISALTHAQIEKLCEREDVQLSMFDEKNILEVVDAEAGIRYGLCKSNTCAQIVEGRFSWAFDEEKIKEEEQFDGCYVIFTNVKEEDMDIHEVVRNYRKLIKVEQAFRNLKTVRLEIRPVYHKTDERIRCHVFLCMLSYYLMWNMKQMLKSILEKDAEGKNKEYTFDHLIERLKSIRQEKVDFSGIESQLITERDPQQEEILKLLGVKF